MKCNILIKSFFCFLISIFAFLNSSQADENWIQFYISPAALTLGTTDVGIDFRISDQFTIGPTYFSMNYKEGELGSTRYEATGYGGRINWFIDGKAISDSWVFSVFGVTISDLTVTYAPFVIFGPTITYKGETSLNIYAATIGYYWVWESFSIKFAMGSAVWNGPEQITVTEVGGSGTVSAETVNSGSIFTGELLFGWGF